MDRLVRCRLQRVRSLVRQERPTGKLPNAWPKPDAEILHYDHAGGAEAGAWGNERSRFDFAAVKRPHHERAETPSATTDRAFHAAMALASSMVTQDRLYELPHRR